MLLLIALLESKFMKNEFKSKKLIIFDMDGTILNTLNDLMDATNYALKLHNFPCRDYEQIRKAVGNGVAMLIKRSLPDNAEELTYKTVLSDFEKYYSLHSSDLTSPYSGMKESLTYLKKKGYILACATNKLEEVAIELINRFYPNLFATVCGDNGIREKKPSKEPVEEIQRRLNVQNKEDIVYIGDSEVDYQTALNSGVDCLLVSYGYRNRNEQIALGLEKIPSISSPKELEQFF